MFLVLRKEDLSSAWKPISALLAMATSPDMVVSSPSQTRIPTASMESITGPDDTIEYMDGDVTPPVHTEADCAMVSQAESPMSNSGTLKARKYKPNDNSPRAEKKSSSPKVPHCMRKESSLPQVKADTVKVMEMFLKRRSKSLNDAVLTKEYFEREKRRKKARPSRNTVTVIQKHEIKETVEETQEVIRRAKPARPCMPRGHDSYVWAMENRFDVEMSGTDNIADDELSSPEEKESRSAPSTLRLHVQRVGETETEQIENGSMTLTRDPHKKERKDVRRKMSILDKAKRIIRSPSTQRKTIVPDDKEYSPSYAKDEVHSEMKKTGFTSRLIKRTFSRKESKKCKDELSPRGSSSSVERSTSKLQEKSKSMEKRSSLERKKLAEHNKWLEKNKSLSRSESKEKHSRRWPFKRRTRKNVPTPTDESAAGASDSASMRDWASSSDISSNYGHSLNEAERRKMLIDIRRGVHLRRSGNFSDSQIMDSNVPRGGRPRSVPQDLRESNGSLASSEGSDRKASRPTSLIFRERRAERSRRGLNDVMNLDSTTPGHIRRNVQTRELEYSISLSMASDLETQGLETSSRDQAEKDEDAANDEQLRRISRASLGSSWTSSTWEESGASGSDVPFDQRSLDEQEEFFKRIADRLAQIGDQVVQEYHFESDTAVRGEEPGPSQGKISLLAEESRSRLSNGASSGAATGSASELSDAIGSRIRSTVDGLSRGRNQHIPSDVIRRVIFDTAYNTFREAVQSLINRNPGMEEISQLALVFHFTKQACKVAQTIGKKANMIKENSINYIGDRFAAWIDSQGGWGVVVESDSEGSVQGSEID
ncbi:hypothetical protein HOLleu_25324 [Holothuria leucospilota]|uniref:Uncharacterized protein n=1 Tax=Holothuria leucospilota TaxID=206669 RepID=A0A9Q1H3E0_HOLLE|nr:hypothetical protein HOLleu_25324 [Holothuria leucospilota]